MTADAARDAVAPWVRYGGLATVAAAVLQLATSAFVGLLYPEALERGSRAALVVGDVVVTYLVLGLVGVVAVYGRYRAALGLAGNLGLFAIAVGAVLGVATVVLTGSVALTRRNAMLLYGGAVLLAVGLGRIGSVPRVVPLLLGLTPLLGVVGAVATRLAPGSHLGPAAFLAVDAAWGFAWVALGYHLWRSPEGPATTAPAGSTGT